MKKWITLICFAGVSCVVFGSDDAMSVRVATYNVENYLIMDRRVDGRWRLEYPKPESEKAALRAVILAERPDVLALQEMGVELFVRELRDDLALEGLEYPYLAWMESNDGVRHLAVLSKYEPLAVQNHVDLDFAYMGGRERMRRGMLEVSFAAPDGGSPWHLFVFHLKSKWTERDDDPEATLYRTREAEAARNHIIENLPPEEGARYLVAGDLNDGPRSGAVGRFLQRGERTLGVLLPTTDDRGHVWTHYWAREQLYSRKDYLIPSPALAERVREGRAHIHESSHSKEASDHRLVYLDLDF